MIRYITIHLLHTFVKTKLETAGNILGDTNHQTDKRANKQINK